MSQVEKYGGIIGIPAYAQKKITTTGFRYIFWNPVKHGLVENPEDYPFSSYEDF